MKPAFAIHKLIGNGGKVTAPGTVTEVASDEWDRLELLGAVREPTEAELALFNLSKPKAAAKPAAKPAAKATAKPAAKATAKPAAETDPSKAVQESKLAIAKRADLEARADKLELKYRKNTSDEKLEAAVIAAEEKAAEAAGSGDDEDLVG